MEWVSEPYRFYCREDTFDVNIIKEVVLQDTYMVKYLRFVPKTILDIGSHIGAFTVFAHHLFSPRKIVSCEMEHENFLLLKKNTEGMAEVECVEGAVIGEVSPIGLKKEKFNTGACSLVYEGEAERTASLVPIESLLKEDVDLLKIDCEGSEYHIFDKMEKLNLFKKVKSIVLEYHNFGNGNYHDLVKLLMKHYLFVSVLAINDLAGIIQVWDLIP